MEHYFEKTGDKFYAGEAISDIKPQFHYLSGATPENIEIARDHSHHRQQLNLPESE